MVNDGETHHHDALLDLAQAGADVMSEGYGQVCIQVYKMDGSLALDESWTARSFEPAPPDSA
jgi:hypothetical protein